MAGTRTVVCPCVTIITARQLNSRSAEADVIISRRAVTPFPNSQLLRVCYNAQQWLRKTDDGDSVGTAALLAM